MLRKPMQSAKKAEINNGIVWEGKGVQRRHKMK
jgi:hypothetical protein